MISNSSSLQEDINAFNSTIEEFGFLGSLFTSLEGLIIISSDQMPEDIQADDLAAEVTQIFNGDNGISAELIEVMLYYPDRNVFVQKTPITEDSDLSILSITLLPKGYRYFKRKVEKMIKKYKPLFNQR